MRHTANFQANKTVKMTPPPTISPALCWARRSSGSNLYGLRPLWSISPCLPLPLQHHMTRRLLLEPLTTVGDPDPLVFGPPGSGSISQRCGSESGCVRHLHAIHWKQCCGSMTFWCGSGSADPCL